MKPKDSPVVAQLRHVWDNSQVATSHSWKRLNDSMHAAMVLAIESGMKFEAADFECPSLHEFRHGKWWAGDEAYYTRAVKTGNTSAAKAMEEHKRRPPFIADDVIPPCGPWRSSGARNRGRLAVGFQFPWQGEQVTVTSFNGATLVACSYKPRSKGEYSNKIKRRYAITVADIKADRAERKKADAQ